MTRRMKEYYWTGKSHRLRKKTASHRAPWPRAGKSTYGVDTPFLFHRLSKRRGFNARSKAVANYARVSTVQERKRWIHSLIDQPYVSVNRMHEKKGQLYFDRATTRATNVLISNFPAKMSFLHGIACAGVQNTGTFRKAGTKWSAIVTRRLCVFGA